MDSAAAFLHRQERKAIERRRKREPVLALVPAYHGERLGLMGVTKTRVLFASRGFLRTPVKQWPRGAFVGARLETKRYGIVRLGLKGGGVLAFEMTHSDHKHDVMGALLPAKKPVDPIKALTARPAPKPRPETAPAADPLAHRQTPEHVAKLQGLVARGMMTQQEMDWQLKR